MSHDLKDDLKEQGYDKEEEFFKKQQQELLERMKRKNSEQADSQS